MARRKDFKKESEGVDIIVVSQHDIAEAEACIDLILEHTDGLINLIMVAQANVNPEEARRISQKVSHLIINSVNTGIMEGRNQGIRAGRYPWVCLVSEYLRIKDSGWLDKMWNYTFEKKVGIVEGAVETQSGKSFLGAKFALMQRKMFLEIGLFDPMIVSDEDWEIYFRAENRDFKTAFCPDTEVEYGFPFSVGFFDVQIKTKYDYQRIVYLIARNISDRIKAVEALKQEVNNG